MPTSALKLSRGSMSVPSRLFQKNFATSKVGFSLLNWKFPIVLSLAPPGNLISEPGPDGPVGVNSHALVSYIGNSTKAEKRSPIGEVKKMLASSRARLDARRVVTV